MSLVGVLKAQFPLTVMYLMAAGLFLIGALAMLPMLRIKQRKKWKVAEIQHH